MGSTKMRFSLATISFYAALVLGQENAINIPSGESTLDVTAGQPTTITWTNPSDGTVTIRLQYSGTDQLADSGIVVASSVPAAAGSASFTIPADAVTADGSYTLRITDDEDPNNFNFAPAFTVAGAEGTASLPASSGASTASGSSTASGTSTTDSSTTDDSSTSSTSSQSSRTSSSTAAAETTEAPDSGNGAIGLQVQG